MLPTPASRVLCWLTVLAVHAASPAQARAADIAFGEYLAGECTTCHRKDGQEKGIPAIIGWPADQFVAVMKAYKAKDRANPVMQTIAGKLSEAEMGALAAYYATLKPK
jgi:cytochrome c553